MNYSTQLDPRSVRTIAETHHCIVKRDQRMADYTSVGVGGPVPYMLFPTVPDEVPGLVAALWREGIKYSILGGGSNLIVADGGTHRMVIGLSRLSGKARFEDEIVMTHAGTGLGGLSREAASQGLSGLEFAVGIPGTVGGAVHGNSGAFGFSVCDRLNSVEIVTSEGDLRSMLTDELLPGYRTTTLPEGSIVLKARFALNSEKIDLIKEKVRTYQDHRKATQPLDKRSAGCVFKNPEGHSAGALIDSCGLKGECRGAAMVSDKHANYLVNRGGATSVDVLSLIDFVRTRVLERTGIELETEVRVWKE